jgi:hypothetical protein
MYREDKLLEVWLSDEGEETLVGWIKHIKGDDLPKAGIYLRRGDICQQFPPKRRNYKIDLIELRDIRSSELPEKIGKNVPAYAQEDKEWLTHAHIFTWLVLELKMEDYEWVFDLDDFEPIDTEEDAGAVIAAPYRGLDYTIWIDEADKLPEIPPHMEKALKSRLDAELDAAIYGSAFDKLGAYGSTSTSTLGDPSDSVLDIEKIERAMDLVKFERSKTSISYADYMTSMMRSPKF